MRYVDPSGREANQLFDTMDEAAIDFAKTYNDDSLRKNKEYGASIYKTDTGKYFYTIPTIGSKKSVKPSKILGLKPVAVIHTHTDGEDMEKFSFYDLRSSNKDKLISYLVISSGGVFKYDPEKSSNLETEYSKIGNPLDITPLDDSVPNLRNYKKGKSDPANWTVWRRNKVK